MTRQECKTRITAAGMVMMLAMTATDRLFQSVAGPHSAWSFVPDVFLLAVFLLIGFAFTQYVSDCVDRLCGDGDDDDVSTDDDDDDDDMDIDDGDVT